MSPTRALVARPGGVTADRSHKAPVATLLMAVFVALLLSSPLGGASPAAVVVAPHYSAGDWWIFRQTNAIGTTPALVFDVNITYHAISTDRSLGRELVRIESDASTSMPGLGAYTMRQVTWTDPQTMGLVRSETTGQQGERVVSEYDHSQQGYPYPLSVGGRWSGTETVTTTTTMPAGATLTKTSAVEYSGTVVGREVVTIAAGTFDALHLQMRIGGNVTDSWMAPTTNVVVKLQSSLVLSIGNSTFTQELIAFHVATPGTFSAPNAGDDGGSAGVGRFLIIRDGSWLPLALAVAVVATVVTIGIARQLLARAR